MGEVLQRLREAIRKGGEGGEGGVYIRLRLREGYTLSQISQEFTALGQKGYDIMSRFNHAESALFESEEGGCREQHNCYGCKYYDLHNHPQSFEGGCARLAAPHKKELKLEMEDLWEIIRGPNAHLRRPRYCKWFTVASIEACGGCGRKLNTRRPQHSFWVGSLVGGAPVPACSKLCIEDIEYEMVLEREELLEASYGGGF